LAVVIMSLRSFTFEHKHTVWRRLNHTHTHTHILAAAVMSI